MAIENLKQDIEREKMLLKEILDIQENIKNMPDYGSERILLEKTSDSLISQLKIINNSIPEILNSISPYKSIENRPEKARNLVKISYPDGDKEKVSVVLDAKDKDKFLQELNLSRGTLKRLRKGRSQRTKENIVEFRKTSFYSKISNRFFQNLSSKYINQGHFKSLNADLRRANMNYLLVTYLSMGFFTSLLAAVFAVIIFIFMAVFFPETLAYSWLVLFLPAAVLGLFYVYPKLEKGSVEGEIDQEIPFVTIHMSAIAGSGIEPTQIFKIIALGEEYPATRLEFKKIINQVNVYGYDLVTALRNTARETSSRKLAELLNGMASSITGGSRITEYLDKRAETLLFEYKLDKEKHTKETETYMDIYISIMIAAPMIMTLLLVLISISGISIGLSLNALTILIMAVVSLINILFLVFLRISQKNF